jgi:imidazolonepropionase-like amidohydrolase
MLVLRDVTVVDTRDGSRTAHRDVHVDGETITRITGSADTAGHSLNRFVVPGYLDMHAHPLAQGNDPAGALALMLAYGVTGFRQMSGSPALLRDRRDGTLGLPADGPELLATPGSLLTPANAGTEAAAVAAVREQHAQGADFIKVAMTTPTVFFAAQAEANRLGLPIAAHLPAGIDVRAASRGGLRSVEHLGPGVGILAACSPDEDAIRAELARQPVPKLPPVKIPFLDRIVAAQIRKLVVNPAARSRPVDLGVLREAYQTFDEQLARDLAKRFQADGTWQCPTLVRVRTQQLADAPEYRDDPNLRYVDPGTIDRWTASVRKYLELPADGRATLRRNYDLQLRLTRIFDEEGVPMIAGSDACGAAWVVPGAALHQEFDELARAGLAPLSILRMATLAGAEFLGATGTIGTVEPGRRADLVLLTADPVEDSHALHAIDGVVRAGRSYDRAGLDALRERVAATRSVY